MEVKASIMKGGILLGLITWSSTDDTVEKYRE